MSTQQAKNTYQYFVLGNVTPVRVTLDENGLKMNAEAPDPQTGELKIRTTLLGRLEQSFEVEEIDAPTFDTMCKAISSKKKRPKIGFRMG